MASLKKIATTDRDEIREWAEERGGMPAIFKPEAAPEEIELRIDFGDFDEPVEEISWDQFFSLMGDNDLAFVYYEETARSGESRLYKLIPLDSAGEEEADEQYDPEMHHGEEEEEEGDVESLDAMVEEDEDEEV